MRLDRATWQEVDDYLQTCDGIIIPTGSTEQHGPMGLIGTDAICAEKIAEEAGAIMNVYVAPTIAYTPASFNMEFPGTISISISVFESLMTEIISALVYHGFKTLYFLNGHGANLEPLRRVTSNFSKESIWIKSWWEFDAVENLRQKYYSDWEGMHATPSEIAITQVTQRILSPGDALNPPKKLSAQYIKKHSGDRHGSAKAHRREFPDGRVGSHSALASKEVGKKLSEAAVKALIEDFPSSATSIHYKEKI